MSTHFSISLDDNVYQYLSPFCRFDYLMNIPKRLFISMSIILFVNYE